MILGAKALYKNWMNKIIVNGNEEFHYLVENTPEDFVIEGNTVDIRLNEVFSTIHNLYGYEIRVEKRQTAKLCKEELRKDNDYYIYPNKAYTVTTMESLFTPKDILVYIFPRMTLIKNNLLLNVSCGNSGFRGPLTFGLLNYGLSTIRIERGVRIAQLVFHEVKDPGTPYNGQWQGGKITSNGEFVGPR